MTKVPFIKSVVAIALGLIFLLLSIDYFRAGDLAILPGVFGLLTALASLAYGVCTIVCAKNDRVLYYLDDALLLSCFLLFDFSMILVVLINGAQNGMSPTDWIVIILMILIDLGGAGLAIANFFLKKPLFNLLANLCFAAFLALEIVGLVMGVGTNGNLGGIPVFEIVFLLAFCLYAIENYRNNPPEWPLTRYEPLPEEGPAEEPLPEEEPAPEESEEPKPEE